MTSRNFKRFAASHRLVAAMVFVEMLVLGLTATAQSANVGSGNDLEGAWRLQVTVVDCNTGLPLRPTFHAVFTFAKGGTATVTTAGQLPSLFTPGLGVWQHTQGHNYAAVTEAFVFSAGGAWIQTHRLTRAIQVDGDSFTDQIALQIFDTSDHQIATGCGTSVGSRMK